MSEQLIRALATDPRDMVPSVVRWAYAVLEAVRAVPAARMHRTFRPSLQAVVWVLAAASEFDDWIPADDTAELLAREAGGRGPDLAQAHRLASRARVAAPWGRRAVGRVGADLGERQRCGACSAMVARVSAAQPGSGPDLSGLQSSYTTRLSRTMRWVMFGAFGLIAATAIARLFGHPDAWDVGLSVLQLVFYSLWLGMLFVLPPSVYLDEEGLRFRKVLIWQRTIPWSRVREVKVQGRWQDTRMVVLDGGKTERLIGMPAEHAQRLADALKTWSTAG